MQENLDNSTLQEILENLKNRVRGITAVFLLDDSGHVLFPEQIPNDEYEKLSITAQSCSNNIALLQDSAEDVGGKLDIVEMELLAKDKRIYLKKIETSTSKLLLCIIGHEGFNVGFAKVIVNAKVNDIIRVLES